MVRLRAKAVLQGVAPFLICSAALFLCTAGDQPVQFPEPEWTMPGVTTYVKAPQHIKLAPEKPTMKTNKVTLITQGDINRLEVTLPSVANQWGCAMSVAIFITDVQGSPAAKLQEARVAGLAARLHEELPDLEITISLLYAIADMEIVASAWRVFIHRCEKAPCTLDEVKDTVDKHYPQLYPVNALRNLALDQVRTPLTFVLDSDLVPTPGLCPSLEGGTGGDFTIVMAARKTEEDAIKSIGHFLVVPAFELHSSVNYLPEDAHQLRYLYKSHKARQFKVENYQWGHGPTNYDRWWASKEPYEILYRGGYEPYVVGPTSLMPRFDERFKGYGKNKVEMLWHAAEKGFKYQVLPGVFVAHVEHNYTSSRDTFDAPTKIMSWSTEVFNMYRPLRFYVRWIYKQFQEEIRQALQKLNTDFKNLADEVVTVLGENAIDQGLVSAQADGSKTMNVVHLEADTNRIVSESMHITPFPKKKGQAGKSMAEKSAQKLDRIRRANDVAAGVQNAASNGLPQEQEQGAADALQELTARLSELKQTVKDEAVAAQQAADAQAAAGLEWDPTRAANDH